MSQVFIAIDLKQLDNFPAMEQTIQAVIDDFQSAEKVSPESSLRYPGQRVLITRGINRIKGIPVDTDLWQQIQNL